jgi:putative heme-binding domain-containing protein
VIEVTDADTGDAYAWLAIGGVEGAPVLPTASPRALAERAAGAAELAARLGLKELAPQLEAWVSRPGEPEPRAVAAKALIALDSLRGVAVASAVLADGNQPQSLRERLGVILAERNTPESRAAVSAAFKAAAYRVQLQWAVALTANREGAEVFLKAVEQGLASPRILQQAGARERLQRANPDRWTERVEKLTRGLPQADEAREKLLAARRDGFDRAQAKPSEGLRIFQQNCQACHQLGGVGGLVGPQLTGIGNRGVERLCEDILDPNRNVDHAFRQTRITTQDGDELAGLMRREEGDLLVLVDPSGKEFSVKKSEVTQKQESELSLMPDTFGESLSAGDFHHLLAYLLSQR